MFEEYRNRISRQHGAYIGDTMRKQTEFVTDQLWMNSISTYPVCVHYINQGLPPEYHHTDEYPETLYAHFESKSIYNAGGEEPTYYLTFRPEDMRNHKDIKVGAYVSLPNVNGDIEYWLIVHIDDDNLRQKCQILKCNRKLRWIKDGVIHTCLGVLRGGSDVEGVEVDGQLSLVDNDIYFWAPTNVQVNTISYDTRFLISNEGRFPPLAWKVTAIKDMGPIGLTRFCLSQDLYNDTQDNSELMIADYFVSEIEPMPIEPELELTGTAAITYNGSKPTIKVGGSWKVFTPVFSNADAVVSKWTISDENGDISTNSNYIIERDGEKLKLKVVLDYNLVGSVLIIQLIGSDSSIAELKVEVVS